MSMKLEIEDLYNIAARCFAEGNNTISCADVWKVNNFQELQGVEDGFYAESVKNVIDDYLVEKLLKPMGIKKK